MSFGKGDAPDRPQYEEWSGNQYTDTSQKLLYDSYNYLNQYLPQLNTFSPEMQSYYKGLANDYTQAQWNDLNRGYTNAMNQMNQRNYNRFGTTNATGSLYDTKSLQNQYNDLASRVASNTASYYNTLINNEFNRRLNTMNAYNSLYNNAGDVLTDRDLRNWAIRNQNLENKYLDQVDDYNNKGTWAGLIGNTLMGTIQGASAGSMFGPIGAAIGGGVGLADSGISYLGRYNM